MNSLSAKVLLAYVVSTVLSIGLLVLTCAVIVMAKGDVLSGAAVAERVEDLGGMLRFSSAGHPVGFDDSEADPDAWVFDSLRQEAAWRVVDASGSTVLSSAAGELFWPADGPARRFQRGRFQFEFEHDGVAMHGATQQVEHDGRVWYLQLAASKRFLQVIYSGLVLPFTGVGITVFSLLLLLVFGACAYLMLRYALRPLRQLSESAAAISPRSMHTRLPTRSVPAEIAPLVDSFNRVLDRLEQGYRTQQDFLATAAHELKTPLALIRAQVELTEEGENRDSLLSDVQHMTRQVQQLLLLAEASEIQNYRFSALPVHDVVKEAADYLQRMADAAEVHLVTFDHARGAVWLADRGALFTLFKNMLENAIQHAPRGSEVRMEVNSATVSVRDWGPGATEDQLAQLFARFWRGAHRRDHGAGLGLAICQEIAHAHGWTLSAHNADRGLRLCVTRSTS